MATKSNENNFVRLRGIAIAANGDLPVVDRDCWPAEPESIRVNPGAGSQTIVSSGVDSSSFLQVSPLHGEGVAAAYEPPPPSGAMFTDVPVSNPWRSGSSSSRGRASRPAARELRPVLSEGPASRQWLFSKARARLRHERAEAYELGRILRMFRCFLARNHAVALDHEVDGRTCSKRPGSLQ